MIFKRYDEYRATIDCELKKVLAQVSNLEIRDGLSYALTGGKRLRPCIMLAAAEAIGGNTEQALPYACALEMLHTSSLIHDDLPEMDYDGLRHGMPSNWAKFGHANALLQGDALLNLAYEYVLEASKHAPDAGTSLTAISLLALSAGANGMLGGQYSDTAFASRFESPDLDDVKTMTELKTARFFEAAVSIPCLLFSADPQDAAKLSKIGNGLGMMYQLADDLTDLGFGKNPAGKTLDKDNDANKKTLARLYGVKKSFDVLQEYAVILFQTIGRLSKKVEPIAFFELVDYVANSVQFH